MYYVLQGTIVVVAVEMILKIVPTMGPRVPVMVADEAEVVIEAITAMIEKAAIGRVSIKNVEVAVEVDGKKVVEEGLNLYTLSILFKKFNNSLAIEKTAEVAVGMNLTLLIKIGQNHYPLMSVWKKNFLEIAVQALISTSMKTSQLKQLVRMYLPISIQLVNFSYSWNSIVKIILIMFSNYRFYSLLV